MVLLSNINIWHDITIFIVDILHKQSQQLKKYMNKYQFIIIFSKENTDVDNHEDCIALNGAYDFCWSDGLCNEGVGYALCEKT